MKRVVVTYGLLAGLIMVGLGAVVWFQGDFEKGFIAGYATMLLAFLMVFFGIRSYRDKVGGGTVSFGKALQVGVLITAVACLMYVVAWEITYPIFLPDFMDRYAAFTLEKMRQSGASAAEIEAERREMARFAQMYKNPFIRAGMTFMEAFPPGVIVSVVSAAILRRKASA